MKKLLFAARSPRPEPSDPVCEKKSFVAISKECADAALQTGVIIQHSLENCRTGLCLPAASDTLSEKAETDQLTGIKCSCFIFDAILMAYSGLTL